jgi:SNF2 family DNA or RNA helicase
MGLGKTIQIISLLAVLYQRAKIFPFLIVVPNSVLDNWKREFNKWAPDMVVMTYGGVAEDRPLIRDHMMFHRQQLKAHVVLTTYEYANMDTFVFRKVGVWEVVVVDEGHRLKNDQSLLLKSLESIKSKFRILLTGTPIQNNIRELFQLVHFLDPKGYNDVKGISAQYEELNETKVSELHDMLKPILLRRTKDEVLHSLPGKAELIVPVSLTQLQKELYKATLAKNAKLLRSIASNRSVTTGRMASFNNILTELRKIINHPYLIDGVEPKFDPPNQLQTHQLLIDSCGKLALLHMLLKELRRRGRKVLIFSQWTRILNVLEDYLSGEDIHYLRIDGTVTSEQRQERIDKFNAPGSAYEVFLLSTRAGGVGINLATASAVVIYDQDFNPHADMQALSRAHRIGQENNVVVFKLLAKGTAEERIAQVGKKKMVLDHLVIEKLSETEVDPTDLSSILQWGAKALFDDDANDKDIKYDGEAVLAIVDKATQEAEAVKGGTGSDGPIGAFAVAQVWSKDGEVADDTEEQVDSSFWSKMLKERIAAASSVQEETYGRGVRRKARKVSWILMIDAV